MTTIPDMDLVEVVTLAQATADTRDPVTCQEHHPVRGMSREVRFEPCDRDADFQFVYDVDGQDDVQRVDYCWRCALPLPDGFDLPPICARGHGPMADEGDEGTRWSCPDCDGVFIDGQAADDEVDG